MAHAPDVVDTKQLDDEAPISKVMSVRTLVLVWAFLIAFAILNYYSATVYLDGFNTFVSLSIALVMGTVSVFFFMHLGFDRPINAFAFVASLAVAVLFITFSIADGRAYQSELYNREGKAMISTIQSRKAKTGQAPAQPAMIPGR